MASACTGRSPGAKKREVLLCCSSVGASRGAMCAPKCLLPPVRGRVTSGSCRKF